MVPELSSHESSCIIGSVSYFAMSTSTPPTTTTTTTDTSDLTIVSVQQHTPPTTSHTPNKKRRRSSRNTDRLRLSNRSSLQHQRLDSLFFRQVPCSIPFTQRMEHYDLQQIHSSPNLYVIDNFLNKNETQYLLTAAASYRFQRSYVDQMERLHSGNTERNSTTTSLDKKRTNNHCDLSHHRTSTFVAFEKQQDATIARIEQKAAKLVGCWGTQTIEPLQLVRYTTNQFFGVHHDMGEYIETTGQVLLPPKCLFSKRRLLTFFCYLNLVECGGDTYFPVPNVSVKPVPGRAVLFCNILKSGQPDPRTIHAGEPVLKGIKYGLNIWITEE